MNKKLISPIRWACQLLLLGLFLCSARPGRGLYSSLLTLTLIFFIGNYYCGWVCPFGTIQDLLSQINRHFIKRRLVIPQRYERFLRWLRYVTLFVSLGAVIATLDARRTFFSLYAGRALGAAAVTCLALVVLLGLFMDRPFCRYICPEGARYGAIGLTRLLTITRDPRLCINCHACDRNCPMNISVSASEGLDSPQCLSCGRCLCICPKEGALKLSFRRLNRPVTLAFFAAGAWFLVKSVLYSLRRFR